MNFSLQNSATLIHTNDWGFKVYMFSASDNGTRRQSYGFVVESPEGRLSNIQYLKRSQLVTSKSAFDFFLDFEADFDKGDLDAIKSAVMQQLRTAAKVDFSASMPIEDVHYEICKFCVLKEDGVSVSVSDGYCNIDTGVFEKVIKDMDCGHKKLEVLRMLKLMNALRVNKNRPYDWKMTDKNGQQYNAYSVVNIYEVEAGKNVD